MKQSFADIVAQEAQKESRKFFSKVPEWSLTPGIEIPASINAEQCSSSATALLKAALVQKAGARRVADLTGGLGVDTWAFSRVCEAVLHNEMNAALSAAVERNFERLGIINVSFSSEMLERGNAAEICADFHPDMLYLDPARRSKTGGKVFLLKDCSPDLVSLKDELFEVAPLILAKVSPMADISLLLTELGSCVKQVHVVEHKGECKELLLLMERSFSGEPLIVCGGESFLRSEEHATSPSLFGGDPLKEGMLQGKFLWEPGAALSKAGMHALLSRRYSMEMLSASSHLYVSDSADKLPESGGKSFMIEDVLEFSSSGIKALSARGLKADVSVKGLPLSSEQLRKRLKARSEAGTHAFACMAGGKKIIILTKRI